MDFVLFYRTCDELMVVYVMYDICVELVVSLDLVMNLWLCMRQIVLLWYIMEYCDILACSDM